MRLSIIIVSWNVRDAVCGCIESIRKNVFDNKAYEIIVVDNASGDGTVESIRQNYPEVIVIANKTNAGFGSANNQGVKAAKGEYIFILNPDTLVLAGALERLLAYMDSHPDVAICGPKILNEDGTVQRSVRNFQTWHAAFNRYTPLGLFGIFKQDLAEWKYKGFNYNAEADAPQLMGAALFMRRQVFMNMGGFDELFFMYYEEVDLCLRVKNQGLRCVYYPDSSIMHAGGRSSSQVPAKKQFMLMQSLIRYLKKHAPPDKVFLLSGLLKVGMLLSLIVDVMIYPVVILLFFIINDGRRWSKYYAKWRVALVLLARYYLRLLAA